MLPIGFWKFLAHSVSSAMCNKSYCVEITPSVSSKKHKATVERAVQLAIRATNPNTKLHNEENE